MLVSSELVVDFDVLNYVGHTAFHIKRNVHIFSFYDEPHHNQKYFSFYLKPDLVKTSLIPP